MVEVEHELVGEQRVRRDVLGGAQLGKERAKLAGDLGAIAARRVGERLAGVIGAALGIGEEPAIWVGVGRTPARGNLDDARDTVRPVECRSDRRAAREPVGCAAMVNAKLILVTGSAGHLGQALVRTLHEAGRAVRGVDRLASPTTDVVGSLVDPDVVARSMDGVDAVIHTATLHKPHVATHTRQAFVDTNVTATLHLLEAAATAKVRGFLYTSTTSTFGDALTPPAGAPAAWVTEDVVPVAKNIYGVTKIAAEELCALAHRNQGMPCLVLRTSRFFPEADDDGARRGDYVDANLKLNELLYRRVDLEDVVGAHLCALDRVGTLPFGRFIISAPTPFEPGDAAELRRDAPAVVDRRVPGWRAIYDPLGWRMSPSLDRVYDSARARRALGWEPRHDFARVLARVQAGGEVQSALARAIGIKGYHDGALLGGLYPDGKPPHR
jgi:nucleoside-diphosphate-sugar epimerase